MIVQVNNFDSCYVTSVFTLDVTAKFGDGFIHESQTFDEEGKAMNWLKQYCKDALCLRLERYIKRIQKHSSLGVEYWHTPSKDESLKWLWKVMPELVLKPFEDVCKNILFFKDRLWQVMPGEQHRDYRNLKEELESILRFAKINTDFNVNNLLTKQQEVA